MNKTVILYSTGCPKCTQLKMLLKMKHVDFVENNDVDKMIELGFLSVPMLDVNGQIMDFKESKEWIDNLGG